MADRRERPLPVLFFFQAEDGIRDDLVTGVQTCALPIFRGKIGSAARRRHPGVQAAAPLDAAVRTRYRSEERRVGKECRSRWWRCREKKKSNRWAPSRPARRTGRVRRIKVSGGGRVAEAV